MEKANKFYQTTSKKEMFMIIEQFAELLKDENEHWTDKAKQELKIIKLNNHEKK